MSPVWVSLRQLLQLTWRVPKARHAFVAGVLEEGIGLAFTIAAPLLLGLAVARLPSPVTGERTLLIVGLVVAWMAPMFFNALKPRHSATIVAGLYEPIAVTWLSRELPPLALAHDRAGGEVLGRLERLPFNLQVVLDGLIWRAAPVALQISATLVALCFAFPPIYAGLLGLVLLGSLFLADRGAARLLTQARASSLAGAELAGALGDVVANAERVVCNGALAHELERLRPILAGRDRAQACVAAEVSTASGVQTAWLIVGLVLVLGLAAADVARRRLDLDGFIVLQAYALRLALPLGGLALSTRQAGAALADLAQPLASASLSLPSSAPSSPIPDDNAAHLSLRAVTYRYPASERGIYDVTLEVEADQTVAIVGANGSGKSTLARVMAGLLSPQMGRVAAGGVDLAAIELASRPSRVLYVPQTVGLFHRSLAENALYPPAASDTAAVSVRLDEWRFYSGAASVDLSQTVGEHGGALSGGQIQKLELARLCAVSTPALILDESTSALDSASEAEIVRALRAHAAGRILVLVTHKLRLAELADRVIFLSQGRIAAVGRHIDLMQTPAYRRLWT